MNSGDSHAPATTAALSQTVSVTPEERRSAVAVFELWQHQWPGLFRGAAWLHLERLKKAIAEPHADDRRETAAFDRRPNGARPAGPSLGHPRT